MRNPLRPRYRGAILLARGFTFAPGRRKARIFFHDRDDTGGSFRCRRRRETRVRGSSWKANVTEGGRREERAVSTRRSLGVTALLRISRSTSRFFRRPRLAAARNGLGSCLLSNYLFDLCPRSYPFSHLHADAPRADRRNCTGGAGIQCRQTCPGFLPNPRSFVARDPVARSLFSLFFFFIRKCTLARIAGDNFYWPLADVPLDGAAPRNRRAACR